MNVPSAFRSALLVDTGGVLALCAIALNHPRSGIAAKRAAVGLAGVALAYPAQLLVSTVHDNSSVAGRAYGHAAALVAAGLVINSVGGIRLLGTPDIEGDKPSGSSALTWMLLLGGNTLSAIYLAAIRHAGGSRT